MTELSLWIEDLVSISMMKSKRASLSEHGVEEMAFEPGTSGDFTGEHFQHESPTFLVFPTIRPCVTQIGLSQAWRSIHVLSWSLYYVR